MSIKGNQITFNENKYNSKNKNMKTASINVSADKARWNIILLSSKKKTNVIVKTYADPDFLNFGTML